MDRPLTIPTLFLAVCLAAFVFLPVPGHADVLRWIDDDGVIHFTDDPGSIPPSSRGRAVTIIRQGGGSRAPSRDAEASPAPPPPPPVAEGPSAEPVPQDAQADEAAQLRAKIEAKEAFVRQVDQKRSLAINPYRNRIVSEADMELYNKYQAELPADRARLKELEPAEPAR